MLSVDSTSYIKEHQMNYWFHDSIFVARQFPSFQHTNSNSKLAIWWLFAKPPAVTVRKQFFWKVENQNYLLVFPETQNHFYSRRIVCIFLNKCFWFTRLYRKLFCRTAGHRKVKKWSSKIFYSVWNCCQSLPSG